MKRALSTTLSLCLGVMASTAIAETKNPGTFVFLWTDDIQSFDPAYIADTPSSGALNVYSRLLDLTARRFPSLCQRCRLKCRRWKTG